MFISYNHSDVPKLEIMSVENKLHKIMDTFSGSKIEIGDDLIPSGFYINVVIKIGSKNAK